MSKFWQYLRIGIICLVVYMAVVSYYMLYVFYTNNQVLIDKYGIDTRAIHASWYYGFVIPIGLGISVTYERLLAKHKKTLKNYPFYIVASVLVAWYIIFIK